MRNYIKVKMNQRTLAKILKIEHEISNESADCAAEFLIDDTENDIDLEVIRIYEFDDIYQLINAYKNTNFGYGTTNRGTHLLSDLEIDQYINEIEEDFLCSIVDNRNTIISIEFI